MVKVIVTVNKNDFESLHDKFPEIQKRGLQLTAQGLIGELTKNSPVDEGLLRQWWISSQSDEEIHIKSPAVYARYVNDGTGIYGGNGIIKPKKGKFLVFKPGKKWKGPVSKKGLVFLRQSKGQKGQKFVEKSMEATRARIGGYFKIAIREVFG